MMGYGINWILFVEERLLSPLRKAKIRAFVHAPLSPLKTVHTDFLIFKSNAELELIITPQVRVLRHWLNQLFDSTERRFVIEDYTASDAVYLPEFMPFFMTGRNFDFVVKAPCETRDQKAAIKAFLDKYKLAGKRYELRFVDENDNPCALSGSAPAAIVSGN